MYTLLTIVLSLWLVAVIGHVGGNFMHILLLVALMIVIAHLVSKRHGSI